MPPSHIAILGGGLTGLSSAYHLSRKFPSSLITLLEKQPRFGGWVRSERVQVKDERGNMASVVLEAGPRTLRPNAKSVLELINLLELKSSLVLTRKTSPAAKNRFLYIPGTNGLQLIPSSITSFFSSSLARILVPAILREPFRRYNRPPGITDESLDSFLIRRFGEPFARTFGSAMVHGIYAADSRILSVRAAFPTVWDAEENGGGSVIRGLLSKNERGEAAVDYVLGDMVTAMDGVSVFSFKEGIRTLTDALVLELKRNPKVQLQSGVGVTSLRLNPLHQTFEITTSSHFSFKASHVVSTLSPPVLNILLPPSLPLPHLTENTSSSVTVMNIVFPPSLSGHPIHPPGFGYLIPRPSSGYDTSNSGILGTVFDSSALSGQDTGRLIKLTIMLGGPHPLTPSHTSLPVVLKHLASHLGHPLPEPLLVHSHSHASCIPTLSVGHLERMDELRAVLKALPWNGRLEVIGAGVGGVSVGDCLEAGKRAGCVWR
ncbi:hypothetical protein PILCRDRAFT_762586 [Piloderma croceum F 1598]|uniref:Protoporphyrinogen oxidase n=1 Tax=Piloderma croceum (strain F 1598) TaxID=765440 RepID=A0A0C3G4V0_PILCF|nr:hypothetical protein PILCRDRAFT_762586 [Piloderma croceum F 1598]